MFRELLEDAGSIAGRDPAARSVAEVVLLYPGFHAIICHRLAHALYKRRFYFLARTVSQLGRFMTGIEIHPGAIIGRGLFIDHGMGIVIGETAEIGNNCTLYHGVTLGGTGKEKGKRHPTIGDNVLVGAGAKLLGPFKVGNNVMIGAGSVVLDEVAPYSTVVGIKARTVKINDTRISPSFELDQIHVPDPVARELCKMLSRIEKVEGALNIRTANINENGDSPCEPEITEGEVK